MGGLGSGNSHHWWRPARKAVVEECRCLDVRRWRLAGILKADVQQTGTWPWPNDDPKEQAAAVGYEVNTADPARAWVRLFYILTDTGEQVNYLVDLQTTDLHSGGRRWWFTCPLVMNGTPCGRRVGRLYLPQGARYFGCRHCYGLTYTSCRESHKYDATARRLAAELGEDVRTVRRWLARRGKREWWEA
jgi:hypothetical protein